MTNNLGQDNNNKKNLPPPKINDEFARKANAPSSLPSLKWEGVSSLDFSFYLSKIVAPTVKHAH